MERRRFLGLAAVGLSSGCLSNLPDATGPRTPPNPPAGEERYTPETPPVRIATFDVEETDDGRLRVVGEVVNDSETERVATVKVRVKAGETESTRTVGVTIPSGETVPFSVEFEIAFDTFAKGGDVDVTLT
ncbi:transcriptional initiation protein Tat [Haloferax sp. S1W]|uniref:transcriptional initiation protein Tat n=1 Tax=Haloferax sp. S1W TaxID=3377110 RepID=UPI0037C5B62B